jgi:hypothetical protein
MADWDEDTDILPEFVCRAIPGSAIDPTTGAWKKKPRPGDPPGKQAPADGTDATPAKGEGDEPQQKNAG